MLSRCATVSAGTCRHPERMVLVGGRFAPVEMPSLVGVLVHPREGVVLFDAGYAPRVLDETSRFPDRLYQLLVPFVVDHHTSAAGRLRALWIAAEDVRHVVISHFHPDHVGGLRDFPNAVFHATPEAFDAVRGLSGLRRLLGAWFPGLLPDDFLDRVHWIDRLADAGHGPFPATADLFGDGSLRLVALPGHAAGQVGLLAHLGARRALFVADACWVSAGFRELRPASRITHLIAHDPAASSQTLQRLHDLWRDEPDTLIIPAHCPEVAIGEIPCG